MTDRFVITQDKAFLIEDMQDGWETNPVFGIGSHRANSDSKTLQFRRRELEGFLEFLEKDNLWIADSGNVVTV